MTVLAIGELVVDWLSIEPGPGLQSASVFHRASGGNASNVAIGLSRLGTPCRLVGKVGADFHGEFLLNTLKAQGVNVDYVLEDRAHPTAQCYMTTTEAGHHHYFNWPRPHAADMLSTADLRAEMFDGISLMFASGISMMNEPRRSAVTHAINIAKDRGCVVAFDACFPTGAVTEASKYVSSMLHKADILKVNQQELVFWTEGTEEQPLESLIDRLMQKFSPALAFITLGSQGAVIRCAGRSIHCPPFPAKPVSEVGAGDAFVAGALHELLFRVKNVTASSLHAIGDAELKAIGKVGNFCGAAATEKINAWEGMPTAADYGRHMGKTPMDTPAAP